jgi:predicted outer membrane repeat protein
MEANSMIHSTKGIPAQPRPISYDVATFADLKSRIAQGLLDGDASIHITAGFYIESIINITGDDTQTIRLIGDSPDSMPVLKRSSAFDNFFFNLKNVKLIIENVVLDGNKEETLGLANCKSLICLDNGAKLELTGYTILKNNYCGNTGTPGAAIGTKSNITNGVEITMSDYARITENISAIRGGGIGINSNAASKIIMKDNSRIDHNTASNYGGGIFSKNTTIEMLDNSMIEYNMSSHGGGGIYAENSPNITISQNSRIAANESTGNGGGIYARHQDGSGECLITLNDDASIEMNTAGESGGGAYIIDNVKFDMKNRAKLCGNYAFGNGGGLYAAKYTEVNIKKDAQICDNESEASGGGLYLANTTNTLVVISGTASFTRNTAKDDGGAIGFINKFNLSNLQIYSSGVTFAENKASVAYAFDEKDRAAYEENISATEFSYGFPEGYNNYDIQYIASEASKLYSITYKDDAGNDVVDFLSGDQTLNELAPPTRENAHFLGWYEDENYIQKLDESELVYKDMIVYPPLECNPGYAETVIDGKITCEKVPLQWVFRLSHIDADCGACSPNAAMHYYKAGVLKKGKPDVCDFFLMTLKQVQL